MPGDVENIFHNAVICQRNSCFKTVVHAGAVHAVQKRCHEPAEIQISNFSSALFFRCVFWKDWCFPYSSVIGGMRIFFHRKTVNDFIGKQCLSGFHTYGPWKCVCLECFFIVKPWITTEDLIGTFAGQCYLIVTFDFGTEIQHRGFDICHTGQVSGIHCVKQAAKLVFIAAFKETVICFGEVCHLFYIRAILTWLKRIRLKILIVILKIKGKCV